MLNSFSSEKLAHLCNFQKTSVVWTVHFMAMGWQCIVGLINGWGSMMTGVTIPEYILIQYGRLAIETMEVLSKQCENWIKIIFANDLSLGLNVSR